MSNDLGNILFLYCAAFALWIWATRKDEDAEWLNSEAQSTLDKGAEQIRMANEFMAELQGRTWYQELGESQKEQ